MGLREGEALGLRWKDVVLEVSVDYLLTLASYFAVGFFGTTVVLLAAALVVSRLLGRGFNRRLTRVLVTFIEYAGDVTLGCRDYRRLRRGAF